MLYSQLSTAWSWLLTALPRWRTSRGPYTATRTLVLPISTYAEPSDSHSTPIRLCMRRSSCGRRPSRRRPSGVTYSTFACAIVRVTHLSHAACPNDVAAQVALRVCLGCVWTAGKRGCVGCDPVCLHCRDRVDDRAVAGMDIRWCGQPHGRARFLRPVGVVVDQGDVQRSR